MNAAIRYALLSFMLVSVGCGQVVEPSPIPYLQRLAEFQTKLTKTGPAPQDFDQEVTFANVKEINRIFAFGHSVGGGVSAMLSLRENVPVQHSGSSGGLYPRSVFWGWSDDCPFNHFDQKECEMRTLFGNIQYMQFPHYAYLGSQDSFGAEGRAANAEQAKAGGKLTVSSAPGDHFSSFDPALRQYLAICEQTR